MENMISNMQGKLKEIGADSMLNAARAKLKELGGENMMNTLLEKLKEFFPVLQNFGGLFISWLDEAFPPETRRERLNHWIHLGAPFIITGLVLLVVIRCCSGKPVKTMKAPGRNFRMQRNDFEASPKSYFRNLRDMKKRK